MSYNESYKQSYKGGGATRRTWIKLHITGWLHGSVRPWFTVEERSVFVDLLALAGECNQEGKICDNSGRAYPNEYISSQLNIPLALLEQTLKKCVEHDMVELNSDTITLINWGKYQSDYSRQKPYRGKARDSYDNRRRLAMNEVFRRFQKEHGREPNETEHAALVEEVEKELQKELSDDG